MSVVPFVVPTPSPGEGFQPQAHFAPDSPMRRLLFTLRLTADLQTNTIYRDLRRELTGFSGRLLDVGCGNSPFRHLLDQQRTEYHGIDVETAASFGYRNPDTNYYDGKSIPFSDDYFDGVLCTEVVEHVCEAAPFVQEIHRVLKPGGLGLVTLPWSARFHYQHYDYHRYTPSMLQIIFTPFRSCVILPRGTDLSVIASKVVVVYARNIRKMKISDWRDSWQLPFRLVGAILALPLLLGALLLGHAGICCGLGSADDPLGYTIIVRK